MQQSFRSPNWTWVGLPEALCLCTSCEVIPTPAFLGLGSWSHAVRDTLLAIVPESLPSWRDPREWSEMQTSVNNELIFSSYPWSWLNCTLCVWILCSSKGVPQILGKWVGWERKERWELCYRATVYPTLSPQPPAADRELWFFCFFLPPPWSQEAKSGA